MVTKEMSENCVNKDYITHDELMYIDEDGGDGPELYRQNSYTSGMPCRKKCIVRLENARYTIVANPPEKAKDDSNLQSKNGQLAPESLPKGTGSLTVLRRSNSRTKVVSNNSSRTSSVASLESDSYASVDLGTDKLPPVDVPEASHVCSLRLKHIVRKLQKEDISKEDLLKNLEYAAQVLETVYIDETSKDPSTEKVEIPFEGLSSDQAELISRCRECSSEAICKCRQRKNDSRRLCDEEDELSEVEPDAVPTEVRDWLALTFTRE
ncbi:dual specificity calcium/calmodulin-dependent 3',5'-cyclic nucleotide phosphodiesterase 1-like isoform X3 [Mya arenaria]|uniref:dual specificity calcium/calmodulin-dependent 3',5'-cyclic nucleotide phosphodiesterase 1-like isoform X3 n=1 Tax=Mya arenaria TaxID=6604 RepID=UPI0022E8F170|nr:dual specificity calcium/calmodulin-dependent 3',5'-cyclic nucleotide phosphodiesterase 1-like isoform X3 [Mya arenaria]